MKKRLAAVLLGLATIAASSAAEPTGPEAIDAWRNRVNTAAMITLGSWALANLGTGTVLSFTTEGSAGHFHEMNALWNTVNLALAGFGLAGTLRADPSPDLFTAIDAQHRLDQRDRLEGYGWSLVLRSSGKLSHLRPTGSTERFSGNPAARPGAWEDRRKIAFPSRVCKNIPVPASGLGTR